VIEMSDLRQQLDRLRREYRSTRYDGDLAKELLPPPRRERASRPVLRWVAVGSLVTGLAAAVALWIGARPAAQTPPVKPNFPVALLTTQPQRVDDGGESVPTAAELSGGPSFPDDLPLIPTVESLDLGSMPSMPSLDFSFADTEASKEST
jgi:hypothetical protein